MKNMTKPLYESQRSELEQILIKDYRMNHEMTGFWFWMTESLAVLAFAEILIGLPFAAALIADYMGVK